MKPLHSISFLLISALVISNIACAATPKNESTEPKVSLPSLDSNVFAPILQADNRLREAGISEEFIQEIHERYLRKNPEWLNSSSRILEMNVLGFLYHGDYFAHDTPNARKAIRKFIRSHQKSFRAAERKYQVSASSIASLLWIETKFGKTMGNFPLPWVYYSILMGGHQNLCTHALDALPKKWEESPRKATLSLTASQNKVIERCQTKATWAIEELKALNEIHSSKALNPFRQRASFAGAFGIPQFIPSSYLKYSSSEFRRRANLYSISDAILSVGRFLHESGWKNESPEAQATALFAYNRSKDYGAVIMQLAAATLE
jgi:membrane-bound lytic murein transglycosylase B